MSYVLVEVPDWVPERDREWISGLTEQLVQSVIDHYESGKR